MEVKDNGKIIVGFDLKHDFQYIKSLDDDIKNNNVKKGEKVQDYFYNCTYNYVGEADFTVSDINDYMQDSIIGYYKKKVK